MNMLADFETRIDGAINPEDLTDEERPIIEAMCRAICEASGRNPDIPVFYFVQPSGWTDDDVASPLRSLESQGFAKKQRPSWSNYAGYALAHYRAHKAMLKAMGV
jgi:hypothetical protein